MNRSVLGGDLQSFPEFTARCMACQLCGVESAGMTLFSGTHRSTPHLWELHIITKAAPAPARQLGLEGPSLKVHGGRILAEAKVGGFAAFARPGREGEEPAGRHTDEGVGGDFQGLSALDEEPAQGIVLTPVVKTALVAGQVHEGTEVLEGQILGGLVQRLDDLAGAVFTAAQLQ